VGGAVTAEEVILSNLIDQRAAQHGYGVQRIEPSPDGSFYKVELTSPDSKRTKSIVIFRDAVEQTARQNRLVDAIAQNIDRELSEGNSGTRSGSR
jgi:hypothetical protein